MINKNVKQYESTDVFWQNVRRPNKLRCPHDLNFFYIFRLVVQSKYTYDTRKCRRFFGNDDDLFKMSVRLLSSVQDKYRTIIQIKIKIKIVLNNP